MSHIGVRDLRNHTADVLRRVEAGEELTVTSRGREVATLRAIAPVTRRPIGPGELARRLGVVQADAGLRDELRELAGGTTDELGPLR